MMLVVCSSLICMTVTRIWGSTAADVEHLIGKKSTFWPNQYKCPECNDHAALFVEGELNPANFKKFNERELEAEDYFRFLMGVGLPEEHNCNLEALQEVFHKKHISKIVGHPISGTSRYCLEALELEDGTKIYFGASSHGATIYRITKKPSYTEKASSNAG